MILHLRFDVVPVPASRPRVSKWGTYYGKNYKRFRKAMAKELEGYPHLPMTGPLEVKVVFYCRRPKKPTRTWPRGDIDNYEKALYDSMNGIVFDDDDQIVQHTVRKQYSEEPRTEVTLQDRSDV